MVDEMERLCQATELRALLAHYQEQGVTDRQVWQARLPHLDGVPARQLVLLHGELLAYGWVEQNTGDVSGCYRITLAGIRALKQVRTTEMSVV